MPATAGRVRMPANNRVHSSAALQTHGIWQSAIGYDPYAPTNKEEPSKSEQKSEDPENAYASFQGLLALARITGSNNNDEARGACKKCGRVGHLTFQCRNFLSVKDDNEKDPDAIQAAVMSGLQKIKSSVGKGDGKNKKGVEESSDEDEEDSESSDSEVDSEMERIIAERSGKKLTSKRKSLSSVKDKKKKKKRDDDSDEDESDSDSRRRRRSKRRRRSHKRRGNSDSEDESRRKRRKEKRRRKKDESSDSSSSSDDDDDYDRRRCKRKSRKEKRRRRSHHRYSDSSDSDTSENKYGRREKRRNKVAASSDSDAGVPDDNSRAGRGSEKRSQKSRHARDE